MIKVIKYPDRKDWPEIVKRPVFENASLEKSCQKNIGKSKSKR